MFFVILLLAVLIVAGLLYFKVLPILNIGLGYAAKTACSNVYISGKSLGSVISVDLKNSAASFVKVSINKNDKTVTASFFGLKKTAVYRNGLGCTLATKSTVDKVKALPSIKKINKLDDGFWDIEPTAFESLFCKVDFKQLTKAFDYAFNEASLPVKNNLRNTRAALVIHKGKLLKEQYGNGFTAATPLLGWSIAKSVINTLCGILVKEGKLKLNEPVNIAAWANDDRSTITLNHLLQMNSGLYFKEVYKIRSSVNEMLWLNEACAQYAIQQKLVHQPSTFWNYSSGSTNIISHLIKSKFNSVEAYLQFPHKKLFEPLGMHSATMETDVSNTYIGSSFMYATGRDWAKFGLLYLQDGVWNGQRVLPEGWVTYSSKRSEVSKYGAYAAHFWKNATAPTTTFENNKYWPNLPDDLYYANGYEGQNIVIIPSKDLVVVRLGQTRHRKNWDMGLFVEEVLKAI